MERTIINEKFKNEEYERVNIIVEADGALIRPVKDDEGLFYVNKEGALYPSDKILDKENEEKYKEYFDFDFEEIINAEDLEIQPYVRGSEELGKITSKTKNVEQTQEIEENEELRRFRFPSEKRLDGERYELDRDYWPENVMVPRTIENINATQNASDLYEETNKIFEIFKGNEQAYNPDEEPIIFADKNEMIDLLTEIYKGLDDENKKQALLDAINKQRDFDINAEDIMNKVSTKDESVQDEENKMENDVNNNNAETDASSTTADDTADNTKQEDKENAIDMNGIEITKYKEELAILEQKLEELEKENLNDKESSLEQLINEELGINIEFSEAVLDKKALAAELAKEENNLKVQQEELAIMERRLANYKEANENPEYIRQAQVNVDNHKQLIASVEQKIMNIKNSQSKKDVKIDKDVLVDTYIIAELYTKEINKSKEIIDALKSKETEYYQKNMGVPLEIYKYQDQLKNIIQVSNEKINKASRLSNIRTSNEEFKDLMIGLQELKNLNDNVLSNAKEKFEINIKNDNNTLSDIEQLKNEINQRKNNIKLYEDTLNDIKKLQDDVNKGLDPNSDEYKNRVDAINNKKEPLPENLKNELDKYLDLTKNKTKTEEKNDKEPQQKSEETPENNKRRKVTGKKILNWAKEHKLAAAAIGLGILLIGVPLAASGLMMINSGLWMFLGGKGALCSLLHSINLGLSKAIGLGAFKFTEAGIYTLGGKAGALALYGDVGAKLTTAIAALGLGALGKNLIDKIRGNKKDKDIEKEPEKPEPTDESKIDELEAKIEKLEAELEKQKAEIENQNKQLNAALEVLQAQGLSREEAIQAVNQRVSGVNPEVENLESEELTSGRSL